MERLARSAFDHELVRLAAAKPHHKEVYVGTVVDERVVEGFIDLLIEEPDGTLVIVDYKTDADPSHETVLAYQRQLRVYERALTDATGRLVSRRVLLICREEGGAVLVEV